MLARIRRHPAVWIVLWSLAVHLPGLTSPLLDYHAHRQTQTASMARQYVRQGMRFLQPMVDYAGPPVRAATEFPLYSYLLALLFKLFGIREILGRLLSITLTAWSAVWLYRLVERRLDERTAFWSALIMCSLPVHIYFTRTVQPESMALWGMIGFARYLDRWIADGRRWDWAAAVLLGAVAPLLKLPFLYLVGGLSILFFWTAPARKRWGIGLAPTLVVGATSAWYRYAATAAIPVLPLGVEEQIRNLMPVLEGRLWVSQFVSRIPELALTYSGLVLGITALLFRSWRRDPLWIGWWFLTAVYTVLLGDYGLHHRYTLLPWAPINAVFIAAGFTALWDRRRSAAAGVLAVILLAGVPVHAGLRIAHWYEVKRDYLFRAQALLARVSRPDDLVLTNTAEWPVLLYYLDRSGYARNLSITPPQEITRLLDGPVRFFLTPRHASWTDHPVWKRLFDRRGRLVHEDPEFLLYELPQK